MPVCVCLVLRKKLYSAEKTVCSASRHSEKAKLLMLYGYGITGSIPMCNKAHQAVRTALYAFSLGSAEPMELGHESAL